MRAYSCIIDISRASISLFTWLVNRTSISRHVTARSTFSRVAEKGEKKTSSGNRSSESIALRFFANRLNLDSETRYSRKRLTDG